MTPKNLPASALPQHPWEQRPGESNKSFEYFRAYLLTSRLQRNYAKLAQTLSCTKQNISYIASHNDWTARARAWDAHQDRIEMEELEKEKRRMTRNSITLAMGMQSALAKRLGKLNEKTNFKEMTVKDIASFARAIAAIEQVVNGQRLQHTGPEGGPIEVESTTAKDRLARVLGAVVECPDASEKTPEAAPQSDA